MKVIKATRLGETTKAEGMTELRPSPPSRPCPQDRNGRMDGQRRLRRKGRPARQEERERRIGHAAQCWEAKCS